MTNADWRFTVRSGEPLSTTALQRAFTDAKQAAGVTTPGRIHGLGHALAMYQLAAWMAVERLQRLLGHRRIQTTLHLVADGSFGTDGI
ncbi:tyrosine-type recombinase/integrase [uncultured Thiodictyon sp.]|uniref:tyrosine-type recombinase/integrase n=1 Tax=uncultured Thiodictyon sp. TaxID=1846217 RepID=UPI0025D0B478|nr:tyrosine-type recombinase/integrase [uncultured Thiodictyon sp.]